MAGKIRHLLERGGRYHARLVVPQNLRPILGRRELKEALGSDRVIALRRLPAAVGRLQDVLDDARNQAKPASPPVARGRPLNAQQMARQHYQEGIAFDRSARESGMQYAGLPFDDLRVSDLRRAKTGAASNEELREVIGDLIEEFRRSGHTDVAAGTTEYRKLAMALANAEYEAMTVMAARDEGDDAAATSHPLLVPAPVGAPGSSPRSIGPDSGQTLSDILPKFEKEKGSRPGTANEYRVAVRMFDEYLGEAKPIHAITRRDVIGYKDALLETPSNYTKRFPGTTLPEAIKRNSARSVPFPTLNATTINDKWLARLHALLRWCKGNDLIPDNPASEVKVEGKKDRPPSRIPFTPGDLSKIFAAPWFAPNKPFDEKHWMALIALHTGFRSSEIAQIRVDSVRIERGILVFAVEEEVKNSASTRLTPIHSTLKNLGIEAYVAALRASGHTHLFPEWFRRGQALKGAPESKVNQPYSQVHPRWFNRTYLRSVGITDTRKVFHSFRHTLKTALSRAGVPRSISDDITGHDDSSSGGKYVHDTSVEAMREALEKIHFDGFKL